MKTFGFNKRSLISHETENEIRRRFHRPTRDEIASRADDPLTIMREFGLSETKLRRIVMSPLSKKQRQTQIEGWI